MLKIFLKFIKLVIFIMVVTYNMSIRFVQILKTNIEYYFDKRTRDRDEENFLDKT